MPSPDFPQALAGRFSALRHRNFRIYWTGQLVSLIGSWMQTVAQGWLLHRLTSSAMMLGLLGFLQFVPVVMFSLWAGVIADRVDKRKMLIATQTAGLLQAVVLAVLVTSGKAEAWMVLTLAFVYGVFNAFDLPARQSFLVEMVGKEDLPNGIALNSAAFNSARVLGPAAAGVLVAVTGEAGCFWINAATFLAVLYSLSLLRMPPRDPAARRGGAALADGVRYVWAHRPLRNLLLLLGFMSGLGFQYNILLPEYAREILHTDSAGYGLMVSAFGVGSLLSAVLMTRKLDRWDLRRNLLIGLVTAAIGMSGFAWSRSLPLTLFMGLLAGFGLILYAASTNTLLQLTTQDHYRGRVMSLYTLMFVGTAPAGALISGALAQRFGAPVATSFSGAVLAIGAIWIAYRLRVLAEREAARPTEPVLTEKLG